MNELVVEFINRRFNIDCNWYSYNSYWFAKILSSRFNSLKICFHIDENRFICINKEYNTYYDCLGYHNLDNVNYLCIDKLLHEDPSYYMKLMNEFKN